MTGTTAAALASEFVTDRPELTQLEGRAWGSWHLYEIGAADYLSTVPAALPPIVKEALRLSLADRFFFIRYADEGGHHVRLRLRLREGGLDVARQATKMIERFALGHSLTVLPRSYELEVERYGGWQHLPLSLDFFCLSSLAALDWFGRHASETRSRQLPALMGLLTNQAVALARSVDELVLILDYFANWKERMEAPVQHGDRTFESRSEQLVALLRLHIEATLSSQITENSLVDGARALSTATLGLVPQMRNSILMSQMHMTANRLGLRNTEESYVTRILQRAFSELARQDSCYTRALDDRLGRQQPTARLDALVRRRLETL